MNREFLVTKFACSKCGNNLQLNYNVPKSANRYADGEPTGAAMVCSVVAIDPCSCTTRPVEDVRQALETLMRLGKQEVKP